VIVGALVVLNIARDQLPPGTLWLSLAAAPALLGFARLTGLSWAELGLGMARFKHGLAWGAGAIGIIGAAYLVGVLWPVTRGFFLDPRYHLPPAEALVTALVVIPIGTVLLEEIAFRSVLWGFLGRHMDAGGVLLVSSGLFGLWHVLPALGSVGSGGLAGAIDSGAAVQVLLVAGTVAFTAVGGLLIGGLRRRSDSVLAAAGLHWATNSLGVLFGMLAWRLATR
jgi:membrane protease YdiL (CAAX protease family)